jgi:DNA-binding transcriptional MerR regulator
MADDEWMRPGEVADLFDVSIWTLYRWERDGTLVPVRNPGKKGQRRYKRVEVEALRRKQLGE